MSGTAQDDLRTATSPVVPGALGGGPADLSGRLSAFIEPLLAAEGFELVDLEIQTGRRGRLRITIDRLPGAAAAPATDATADGEAPLSVAGVNIADCARVSRLLSPALDAEDPMPGAYTLEVSSPGVERPLKRPRDFARFVGAEAKAVFRAPLARGPAAGRTDVVGRILAAGDLEVTFAVGGEATAEGGAMGEATEVAVPYDAIRRAHLVVSFDDALRGGAATGRKAKPLGGTKPGDGAKPTGGGKGGAKGAGSDASGVGRAGAR